MDQRKSDNQDPAAQAQHGYEAPALEDLDRAEGPSVTAAGGPTTTDSSDKSAR